MGLWLAGAVLFALALVMAGGLRVQRHSRRHLVARLTICGRGLYVARTRDGIWWKLRLRRDSLHCLWPDGGEEPPDIGVREPRRPPGSGPVTAARLDLP